MVLLRRFCVLVALLFWQGGFFFYASVVVPVGTDVFARHYPPPEGSQEPSGKRQQGRITRTVAPWLNVAGAVALVPLVWDVFGGTDTGRRKRWRGVLCFAIAVQLAVLIWLYFLLDRQFDRERLSLTDEPAFIVRHRVYLWVCAAQWACCLLFLWLTLRAWRAEDVSAPRSESVPSSTGG
jgi:hypothetical protein